MYDLLELKGMKFDLVGLKSLLLAKIRRILWEHNLSVCSCVC